MSNAAGVEPHPKQSLFDGLAERWFTAAPGTAATTAFAAGALTLLAIATPALPHVRGIDALERLISEMPELSASVGGVALMGLATGLIRRIDAAWAATTALLTALCAYALMRHGHLPAGVAAGTAAFVLALSRRAFFRRSRLFDLAPDQRVALGIAAALGVAFVGALLWAGGRPGFADAPWWALLTDSHLGRPGRALMFGGAGFAAIMAHRYLLSRRRGTPEPATDVEFDRAEALIQAAPDAAPDAQLAFTGDKSFLFVEGGFVMTARGGASLIAMGDPVGDQAAGRGAIVALRNESERLSLRPVVYAATPELLPDLLDLNFRIEKIGENAIVDLDSFNLEGPARQKQRAARRRFVERDGAVFDLREPTHDPALWAELRPISDAWLATHGGKEKTFSLGAFEPRLSRTLHDRDCPARRSRSGLRQYLDQCRRVARGSRSDAI